MSTSCSGREQIRVSPKSLGVCVYVSYRCGHISVCTKVVASNTDIALLRGTKAKKGIFF